MVTEFLRLTLTELVLHGHDDLHLVQAVQAQVFHEVGGALQLWGREGESLQTETKQSSESVSLAGMVKKKKKTKKRHLCFPSHLLGVDLVVELEDVHDAVFDVL